jgi:hypothetical protein
VTESRTDNECDAFSKAYIVKLYKVLEAFHLFQSPHFIVSTEDVSLIFLE